MDTSQLICDTIDTSNRIRTTLAKLRYILSDDLGHLAAHCVASAVVRSMGSLGPIRARVVYRQLTLDEWELLDIARRIAPPGSDFEYGPDSDTEEVYRVATHSLSRPPVYLDATCEAA